MILLFPVKKGPLLTLISSLYTSRFGAVVGHPPFSFLKLPFSFFFPLLCIPLQGVSCSPLGRLAMLGGIPGCFSGSSCFLKVAAGSPLLFLVMATWRSVFFPQKTSGTFCRPPFVRRWIVQVPQRCRPPPLQDCKVVFFLFFPGFLRVWLVTVT